MDRPPPPPLGRDARHTAWLVFFAALAAFFLASRAFVRPEYHSPRERAFLLGGDEPWYLMTARSLARDGDLNVYNDFRDHGLLDFLDRDHTTLGYERFMRLGHGRTATPAYWEQRRYLMVRPGLPALLAPAYRLGRAAGGHIRLACVWTMGVLGALLVRQMFLAAVELGAPAAAAAGCALAGGLSLPLLAYTTQLYTELPAALLLLLALRMLFTSSWPAGARAAGAGLALAGLPWLHDKYYLLQMLVVAAAAVRLRRAPPRARFGFWLPLAVSWAGQGWYYMQLYGVPYPVTDHGTLSLRSGLAGGLAGLWVDRADGLFPYWPAAPLALAGLALLWRRGTPAAPWLAGLALAHWISVGLFPAWNGGLCAPLRYWVPVMPLWVVGTAVAAGGCRGIARAAAIGLLAAGVAIGAYNMTHPRRLFADAPPLGGPVAERAYRAFPDLQHPGRRDAARAAAWLAVLTGAAALFARAGRRAAAGPTRPL